MPARAPTASTSSGSPPFLSQDPATLEADQAEQATLYQEKVVEYGLPADLMTRNFAQQGFIVTMSMVQRAAEVAAAGEQVDGQTLADAFAATDNAPQFGSTPISCSAATAPYISVCNSTVSVAQWNGESRDTLIEEYSAIELVEGTEIRTTPVD